MSLKKLVIAGLFLHGVVAVAQSIDVAQTAEPTNVTVEDYDSQAPKVFGGWMFKGDFARESFAGFNPDYQISVGDRIAVRVWGGYEYEDVLTVDAQGNIFVAKLGPVRVLGVRNAMLSDYVENQVSKVYAKNVGVYASLEAAQPVKVYVTGFVEKPGLYAGLSSDSVLHYLDKAGGISARNGSYIDITLLRNGQPYHSINLYEFLLRGLLPPLQLRDGDVIRVNQRRQAAAVTGLVQNPYEFEFEGGSQPLQGLLAIAKVQPTATHVRVIRNQGTEQRAEYYPLSDVAGVQVKGGDQVEVTADKKLATIAVRVEGEHDSAQEYILPYGSTLGELIDKIDWNERSDVESIQLFRESVQKRQKQMLARSLQALESSLLTARSATSEEAKLRSQEADLILQWVKRAQSVEPSGQVVLADSENMRGIVLEPSDVIRVPRKTSLVMIHGDVLIPNTVVFDHKKRVEHYIAQAGGFTQDDGNNKVLLLHRDGTFTKVPLKKLDDTPVKLGDEIMVMPRIDTKSLQVTKDITQVMYQIAVSAGVLLTL